MTSVSSPTNTSGISSKAGRLRAFNWSLITRTLIVVFLLAPTAYGWHAYQLHRSATTFRAQAEQWEQKKEWNKAADFWLRYSRMQPEDGEARVRLALAFGHSLSGNDQLSVAADFYAVAIGIAPKQVELHRNLADVLLRMANLRAAAERAREGLTLAPQDPGCLRTVALALHGQARLSDKIPTSDVIRAFSDGLQANPQDVDLAAAAARFYREDAREMPEEQSRVAADEVMNRLVSQASNAPAPLLARYEYRIKYELPGADADLDRALEISPKNSAALYYVGMRELIRRAFVAAEGRFREAIQADGTDHRGYLGLAKSLSSQGKRAEAADTLRRGIQFVRTADLALRSDWAALLTSLDRLDEARELINSLERTSAFYAPLLNSAERIELQNGVRLLRCQWLMSADEYLVAIRQLRGLLTTPSGARAEGVQQHTQGYVMLGNCHAALNQWDMAATAYEQATRLQPLSAGLRVQQAEALEQAGQFERAIRIYENAIRMKDVPNTAHTSLARCRLRYQLSRPDSDRNWTQFETDLVTAQQSQSDGLGVLFLQANYAVAQGRKNDAIAIMRKAEIELSEVTDAWASIAIAYEQWGLPLDADRAWQRYRQLKGPSAEEVALRCELLSRREQYDAARNYVKERLPLLKGEDHRRARATAAFLELRSGNVPEGILLLERLVRDSPQDVRSLETLGEIYLERGEFDRAQEIETALTAAEGVDGCSWRELECRRIFGLPGKKSASEITRIVRLQSEIETLRPSWPRGYLVKGILNELQNNIPAATAAYERALQLGDQRPEVYRQLIPLLFAAGRLSDANRYLAALGPEAVVDLRTTLLSINAHLENGQEERAVEIARVMSQRDPSNAMSQIWLGQTLQATGKLKEAEEILRGCIQKFPEDPRTWMGMFGFHLRQGNKQSAEQVIQELAKHTAIKAEQRVFIQAQGYEMLGNDREAKRLYLEARQLAPNDVTIQQVCGIYLLRRSPDDAERSLRRVLDMSPTSAAARRALASLLAARGGEKAWQEAWALLEHQGNNEEASAADDRLRALLLVHRGTKENRRQALEIMERLTLTKEDPSPGDRLLLARLYDDAGQTKEATAQLLLLTGKEDCDVSHLLVFVDFLLRHQRHAEAAPVLKRLETRVPENIITIGLRARWFQAAKNEVEIRPLIDGFVTRTIGQSNTPAEQSQILLEAANLYATLNMAAEAERYYRRLLEASPREYRFLARFLVLTDRPSQAVSLCIQAAETQDLVTAASLLCSVLARGQATQADHERAEPVIARALKEDQRDVSFLFSLATLRYFQQRKEEALTLYLKVLETFPEHVAVLNNVSNLLSEIPERRSEAIEYINRALVVQGPHTDLLDTLGIVQLRVGNTQDAIQAFEQACAAPSPDARYFFHLALAYAKSGRAVEARKAMASADKLDLAGLALTAEERLSLNSLQRQLAEK